MELAARPLVWADPIEVLEARSWARARLYAEGKFDLHSAIDVLQDAVAVTGLIDTIGQDQVQVIMAAAFAPLRAAEEGAANDTPATIIECEQSVAGDESSDDDYEGLSASFARACRIADQQQRSRSKPDERSQNRAAASTIAAAEFLQQQNDPQRLHCWLMAHSQSERIAILDHIKKARS
jgi:hypothetical protein